MDPAALRSRLDGLVPSGSERTQAERTLKTLNVTLSEQNLRLAVAARQYLNEQTELDGKQRKITPKLWSMCSESLVSTVEESMSAYLVPKSNCPNLAGNPKLKGWLLDPNNFKDLPPSFDVATQWLVDAGCPREGLGLMVRTVKVSLARETRISSGPDSASSSNAAIAATPGPVIEEVTEEKHDVVTATAARPAPRGPKSVQKLTRLPSSPGGEVQFMLEGCSKSFEGGVLDMPDANAPCVRYWVDYFCRFATKQCDSGSAGDDVLDAIRTFPKYVATQLLDLNGAYSLAPSLLAPFVPLKKSHASQIFPEQGLLDALLDTTTDNALFDVKKFDYLSGRQHNAFIHSIFYKEFMDARFAAKKKQVANDSTSDPATREDALKDLHKLKPDDAEVVVAMTLLSTTLERPAKLKYLHEDPTRWQTLQAWSPAHPLFGVRALLDTSTDAQSSDKIVSAIEAIVDMDSVTLVKSPVARQVAKDYASMKHAAAESGRDSAFAFLRGFLNELVCHKMGIAFQPLSDAMSSFELVEPNQEFLRLCSQKICKAATKDMSEGTSSHHKFLVSLSPRDTGEQKQVDQPEKPKQSDQPETPKQIDQPEKPNSSSAGLSSTIASVGDKVITISRTKKWHGVSGVVINVKSKKATIKFDASVEGVREKDYEFDKLKIQVKTDEPKLADQPEKPEKPEKPEQTEQPAAKRPKLDVNALFAGKVIS